MRFALLCASLSLMLTASVLSDLRAEEEKKPADKVEEKGEKEKVITVAVFPGVIQSLGESTRELTLKVTLRTLEANPGAQADYVRRQQAILQRQQQIMMTRNPVQRQQQMQQLYRDAQGLMQVQANLFRIKETSQNITLVLADDVKVRSVLPPEEFDEKGNIKRYTAAELKKLRGEGGLPGFEAGPEILEKDRPVLVKVIRRLTPLPKDKEKEKDKESMLEKGKAATNGLEVSLVLVGVAPMK